MVPVDEANHHSSSKLPFNWFVRGEKIGMAIKMKEFSSQWFPVKLITASQIDWTHESSGWKRAAGQILRTGEERGWKWKSEVAQSCPTLRDPVDCSPPGSSVHGILQARILEWGACPSPGTLYFETTIIGNSAMDKRCEWTTW